MNNAALWQTYKQEPSTATKKEIMVTYTNLVHYVIHHSKFINLNVVDEKDYFQFGVEGLSEAIERFDPDYGTKFETYAIQRIRGKIIDELRKLQIKPRTLNENGEHKYKSVSLNQGYDNDEGYTLEETIASNEDQPDQTVHKNERKELLIASIKKLTDRDRMIVTLYYYENLNYKEIAEILGITVSRVSQIHSKIMKELKNKIQAKYA